MIFVLRKMLPLHFKFFLDKKRGILKFENDNRNICKKKRRKLGI